MESLRQRVNQLVKKHGGVFFEETTAGYLSLVDQKSGKSRFNMARIHKDENYISAHVAECDLERFLCLFGPNAIRWRPKKKNGKARRSYDCVKVMNFSKVLRAQPESVEQLLDAVIAFYRKN